MASTQAPVTPDSGERLFKRLTHFNHQLARAKNRDSLVQITLTGLFGLYQAEIVELNLIEPSSGRIVAHRVTSPQIAAYYQSHPQPHYHLGQGLTGWLVEHGQPLHVKDLLPSRRQASMTYHFDRTSALR